MFTSEFVPEASPEQMRWFNELQKVTCSTENALRFDEVFSQIDVLDLLPRVAVPTIIFHPKDDHVVPFECGRQLAALIPGARFVPLEGRNHILLESEPAWDTFQRELHTFLGSGAPAPTSPTGARPSAPDDSEIRQAAELLAGADRWTVADFQVVGSYVRFDPVIRNPLKDFRQRVVAGLRRPTRGRESYLLWGQPGSGKTYLVQQVAESVGSNATYVEINLARLDEAGFRAAIARLGAEPGPALCLVDEVDARPTEGWPYEALLPHLEPPRDPSVARTFVLAGSSASSLDEMKQRMSTRPKGSDLLSRIPASNEFSIPALTADDKLAVVLAQLTTAAAERGRTVREVEKLALCYVLGHPQLGSPRQLREVAVRCVERLPEGEDRIKYDHLFEPGDGENKEFWLRTRPFHAELLNAFVSVVR
jgi:hypothetical protein